MKCKYPPCENDVEASGTRKEYCSNAHKQADYRRRKIGTDDAVSQELSQALTRISTLEQTVLALEEYAKSLDRRLQDLEVQAEKAVEPLRELVPVPQSREVQTQYHDIVSIPLTHSGISFFLPDFSLPMQEGYWCDAVEQDVRAWLAVLPEREVKHGYYLTQKMWDKSEPCWQNWTQAGEAGQGPSCKARSTC